MTRACGGAPADGHTDTIRPRRSKASEPQIAAGIAPEAGTDARPSGPGEGVAVGHPRVVVDVRARVAREARVLGHARRRARAGPGPGRRSRWAATSPAPGAIGSAAAGPAPSARPSTTRASAATRAGREGAAMGAILSHAVGPRPQAGRMIGAQAGAGAPRPSRRSRPHGAGGRPASGGRPPAVHADRDGGAGCPSRGRSRARRRRARRRRPRRPPRRRGDPCRRAGSSR